jgi:hypothetical protein
MSTEPKKKREVEEMLYNSVYLGPQAVPVSPDVNVL